MSLDINTSIALASAFVAACALGVTIWQGRQNHKHNKLSVRPLLATMEHHHVTDNIGYVAFELINCGVGPAIIKNFVLLFGDQEVSRNNRKTYDDFLKNKCEGYMDVYTGQYVPGGAMQAGEKHLLLSFKYDTEKQDVEFAHQLNLLVDYQRIYEDETFTYDSRKDRLFHGREVA